MVDGIATSLIPLTTTCNFRLHLVVTEIRKAIGAPNLGHAKCWIFLLRRNAPAKLRWPLPSNGQQTWAVSGSCRLKENAESPKSMAKSFEIVADYGSATPYILMKVATSVGTALRAVIATTIVAYRRFSPS